MTDLPKTDRLFVYGIFLDWENRVEYGMSNPEYTTVLDYATFGGGIVEAVHIPGLGLSLTGLAVDMNPDGWQRLDQLEYGYDRVIVTTTDGERVYMYVRGEKSQRVINNKSSK